MLLSLKISRSGGEEKIIPLHRSLCCMGRGPENDISFDDPSLPECPIRIRILGNSAEITSLAAIKSQMPKFAGKPKARMEINPGDTFTFGDLTVSLLDTSETAIVSAKKKQNESPKTFSVGVSDTPAENSMEMLLRFSEALLQNKGLPSLMDLMLDQVIALTNADRGFLLLAEAGGASVYTARGAGKKALGKTCGLLSESIVKKAMETQCVQLVHDALSDPDFSQSESVMTRGFHSVLCMPLTSGGETIGLIYLGNDRFSHRFDEKSVELLKIWSAQGSLILRNALLMNELSIDNAAMEEVMDSHRFGCLVGDSEPMRDLFRKIAKVAPTDAPVLLIGETGTGKELVAEELHRRSRRSKGPFVAVNCGAIPENLMESELFGHLRGAFTGAVATRRGKFQLADGGTLFLDEVGEMPAAMQVKLLRAIQEKMVTKVGDNRPEQVDIRIIAATNRILEDEVKRGTFREDLFYRLNVVQLRIPPLRDRGGDISLLASYFLAEKSSGNPSAVHLKGFTQKALAALKRHPWPGNVRELEHAVEKAVVMADGPMLTEDDLGMAEEASAPDPILPLAQAKDEFQRRYIDHVLELNDGNRAQTARDLGVDPRTIYRHLESKRTEEIGGDSKFGEENVKICPR